MRALLGVQVQHPRLAADVPHSVHEPVALGQQDVAVSRHVDHAVVGRDDHAGAASQRRVELSGRGIHPLERGDPLVRLPAAPVADRRPGPGRRDTRRIPDAARRGPRRVRPARTDRRRRGTRLRASVAAVKPVPAYSDFETTKLGRVEVSGVARCHSRGRPSVSQPRSWLSDLVGVGDEGAIADDAVLARQRAGEQARQRGRRRAGEHGARDILLRPGLREESGVSRARGEVVRAETVEHEDDRAGRRCEPVRSAVQRRHHLRHDTGEAPGSGRVRG